MDFIRHMRRSAFFPGRPGGLIREITWKGNIGRKAKNFRGDFTFLRKEKGFRSISNRVSFPPGEIRKISADINLERKLSTVKRTAHGEADAHGNAAP